MASRKTQVHHGVRESACHVSVQGIHTSFLACSRTREEHCVEGFITGACFRGSSREKSLAFLSRGMGPEMAAPTMVIPMRCLFFLLLEAKPGTRRWSVDIARWPQQVLSLALERLSAGCP